MYIFSCWKKRVLHLMWHSQVCWKEPSKRFSWFKMVWTCIGYRSIVTGDWMNVCMVHCKDWTNQKLRQSMEKSKLRSANNYFEFSISWIFRGNLPSYFTFTRYVSDIFLTFHYVNSLESTVLRLQFLPACVTSINASPHTLSSLDKFHCFTKWVSPVCK